MSSFCQQDKAETFEQKEVLDEKFFLRSRGADKQVLEKLMDRPVDG